MPTIPASTAGRWSIGAAPAARPKRLVGSAADDRAFRPALASNVAGTAIGPDGSFYFRQGRAVRRMTPRGQVSLVAGGLAAENFGIALDPQAATSMSPNLARGGCCASRPMGGVRSSHPRPRLGARPASPSATALCSCSKRPNIAAASKPACACARSPAATRVRWRRSASRLADASGTALGGSGWRSCDRSMHHRRQLQYAQGDRHRPAPQSAARARRAARDRRRRRRAAGGGQALRRAGVGGAARTDRRARALQAGAVRPAPLAARSNGFRAASAARPRNGSICAPATSAGTAMPCW